jgi:hypothetical protein
MVSDEGQKDTFDFEVKNSNQMCFSQVGKGSKNEDIFLYYKCA